MPRAFLISHKIRFEEGVTAPFQDTTSDDFSWIRGDLDGKSELLKDCNDSAMLDNTLVAYGGSRSSTSGSSSSGDSGMGSPSRDVGKLPDSPRSDSALEETPTSVLDSPPFKKREFFNKGARLQEAKSIGVSDGGESDSGCSSHNESRNETSTEAEYNWDCPSSFSVLLELMAQSPQRYMGRDTTADHLCVTDKTTAMTIGKQKNKTVESIDEKDGGIADQLVSKVERNRITHLKSSSMSPTERIQGGNESLMAKTWTNEVCTKSADIDRKLRRMPAYIVNDARYPQELIQGANALYDLSTINSRREAQFTQRKIVFNDGPNGNDRNEAREDYRTERSVSPSDEPIDYSQLSSRSKERQEAREYSKANFDPKMQLGEHEVPRTRIGTGGSLQVSDMTLEGSIHHPQYEFILSPKMDRNGNLILGQVSPQSYSARALQYVADIHKDTKQAPLSVLKAVTARDTYAEEKGDPHPSTIQPRFSPQRSVSASLRDDFTLDLAHPEETSEILQNRPEVSADNSSYSNKSLGVYHPKLKYLLAATQVAKRKAEEEEVAAKKNQKYSHSYDHVERLHLSGQEESIFSRSDQSNTDKHSTESLSSSSYLKQELHLQRTSNYDTTSQNDHYLLSKSMQESQMLIMSHKTSNIIDNIHPSGLGDAGITNHGNALFHPHSSHQLQPHNVFQYEFPTSAVVSDIQISNNHKGSEQNLLNPFEVKLVDSQSSNLPSLSPHHFNQQQQLTSIIQHTSSLGEVFKSPLSLSTSPSSPLDGSIQALRPGIDPYECSECGKRYSTSSNLARHRQTHRSVCDKKARKCPHCDKVYVSMPAYSMHVRTHNQGCQCPHCGKKFSRPWLLQGHIRTHTGEKPFACNQCGKSFADKSNLRAHVQTHSTEKPYVCGRCGKAFALKSYLYKHEESSCMRGQRFNRR